MRSDLQLMASGFLVGIALGAFALTSVSASVSGPVLRSNRLAAAERAPLSYDDLQAHPLVQVSQGAATVGQTVDYYDARGTLVYHSDPAQRMTIVAKGTVIPTPTARERDAGIDPGRLVKAEIEEATVR